MSSDPKKNRVKTGNSTKPVGKICQETLVVNGFVQLLCIGFYKFIDLFWQQCLGFRTCAFRFDTKKKILWKGRITNISTLSLRSTSSGEDESATSPKVQLVGPVDPCSCTRCCKSRKRTLRYSYASSRRQCLENMDPMDPREWRGFRVGKQKLDILAPKSPKVCCVMTKKYDQKLENDNFKLGHVQPRSRSQDASETCKHLIWSNLHDFGIRCLCEQISQLSTNISPKIGQNLPILGTNLVISSGEFEG